MKHLLALCLFLGLSVSHADNKTDLCFKKADEVRTAFLRGERASVATRVQLHIDTTTRLVAAGQLTRENGALTVWNFTLGYSFGLSDMIDAVTETPREHNSRKPDHGPTGIEPEYAWS